MNRCRACRARPRGHAARRARSRCGSAPACPAGGDDRPDGGADADMHIRHRRDMAEHERHLRDIGELGARLVVDRHAARPQLDMHAALDMLAIVSRFSHRNRPYSEVYRYRGCDEEWLDIPVSQKTIFNLPR